MPVAGYRFLRIPVFAGQNHLSRDETSRDVPFLFRHYTHPNLAVLETA